MKNVGVIAVRTALGAYLRPLANDGALPLRDLVQPGMSPDAVAEATKKHFSKLDIDVDELTAQLQLARDEAEEMDEQDAEDEEDDEAREERERKEEEEAAARDKRAKDRKAKDAKAKDGKRAKDGPPAGPSGPRDRSKGAAEDADSIRATLRQEFKALRQAEEDVRPLVGQLIAMDSADEVYATTLKQLGVKIDGVHPSAYPALIDAQKQLRSKSRPALTLLAGDASSVQTVDELFPGSKKPLRA